MEESKKYVRPPWLRFIGMWAFILFCAIAPSLNWPPGPFNLPWGTFLVCWVSFLVLIVTTFIYTARAGGGE
jgi:hypothetical protein